MATRALVVLRIPLELKRKLSAKRTEGFTINGYITHLLERALNQQPAAPTRGQKER